MQLTISGRRLLETIKQLEGLPADTSVEEVQDRLPIYEPRLFNHLRNFGITGLQNIETRGPLSYFQVSFEPSFSAEHVQTRLDGVGVLAPNSVSVELRDLAALFPDPVTKAAVEFAADDELPKLQRVTLPELRAALPEIQLRCCFGQAGPKNLSHIASFEEFLAVAGKKDPLAEWEKREAAQRQEVEAYQARQQASRDAFWNRSEV